MKNILLILLISLLAENCYAKILYSWAQPTKDQKILARALVDDSFCPQLKVDHEMVQMQPRFVTNSRFATNLCEATLGKDVESASIGTHKFALPKTIINKILIIGDTSCNYGPANINKECTQIVDCSLAKIAKLAEKHNPDLIIHLGDFHFNTIPCRQVHLANNSFDNFGYNSWEDDFFRPVKNLLNKAPWVMLRGNHEDCKHAWEGWNKFLDLNPVTDICEQQTAPYYLHFSGLHLLIMDSSAAGDKLDDLSKNYLPSLKSVQTMASGITDNRDNIWFLTHKPIWSSGYLSASNYGSNPYNETLYKSAREEQFTNIGMNLHGHLHFFQALSFIDQTYPPQIIGGNGGNDLLTEDLSINNHEVNKALNLEESILVQKLGFTILDREEFGWRALVIDHNNSVQLKCKISNRNMRCR